MCPWHARKMLKLHLSKISMNLSLVFVLYLLHPRTAAAAVLDTVFVSSKCTRFSSCSTHNLSCDHGPDKQRLVLRDAWNGFIARDHLCNIPSITCLNQGLCCQTNDSFVCKERFTDTDFAILSAECSARSSCSVEAIVRNAFATSCYEWSFSRRPFSSSINYSCVPESSILTTSRYTYAVNVHSASLLLDMPSLSSHAGSCRITAFRRRATRLRLYSYAVKNLIYNYSWNVTVTDITGYSYVFNSSQPAKGRDSSVMKLLDVMLLPVTVCVHFKLNNYPDLLWIGFQADDGPLSMECAADCSSCHYTPATPHGRTVTSGPPLTPPSYPGKTTRRQTMPSTPIWHYSTFHPYHRSTTAPWTWSPSPWRHGNTTSISHVTTRHDHSISHDVGSSGSAAKHGQDDVDNTGLVVGVLMVVLMLVAGTAIALVLYKRRLQKRRNNAQISLPSVPRVDDGGYCVPVLSTSGVAVAAWNPGYHGQNSAKTKTHVTDKGTKGPGVKVPVVGLTNTAYSPHKESNGPSRQGCRKGGSLVTGACVAEEQNSIYMNIDGRTEDDESGIDAQSFDSEFENAESPDLAASRDHVYCNFQGTELGDGSGWDPPESHGHYSEHPDNEQIYFELDAEYKNCNPKSHMPDSAVQRDTTSSDWAIVYSPHPSECAASAEEASAVPAYPLPPEPDRSVASKLKRGARGLGRMLLGWMPRREKRDSPAQVRMSDLYVHPSAARPRPSQDAADNSVTSIASAPSLAACSWAASSTSASWLPASPSSLGNSSVPKRSAAFCSDERNRQRSLPYVPHSQITSTAPSDHRVIRSEKICDGSNSDEDGCAGVYHLARPVDSEQDEDVVLPETTNGVPFNSSLELNENDASCGQGDRSRHEPNGNDARFAQGDQSRHGYENQLPRELVSQLQLAFKNPKSATATVDDCPRDEEGYTLVKGKVEYSGKSAPTLKTATRLYPPADGHSLSLSTEDSPYNHTNSGKDHVTGSTYDHVNRDCHVRADQSSHVYCNMGSHMDQEDC